MTGTENNLRPPPTSEQWNAAEKKILEDTLNREEADLFQLPPSQRIVTPEFLQWVIGSRQINGLENPAIPSTGVSVQGTTIMGRLNLVNSKIKWALCLKKCAIQDGIDLRGATTTFLSFEGSETEIIKANGIKVKGDLRLNNGFKAKYGLSLPNSKISGNLDCRNSRFWRMRLADLPVIHFWCTNFEGNSTYHFRLQYRVADFPNMDSISKRKVGPAIVADNADIEGSALCSDNQNCQLATILFI